MITTVITTGEASLTFSSNAVDFSMKANDSNAPGRPPGPWQLQWAAPHKLRATSPSEAAHCLNIVPQPLERTRLLWIYSLCEEGCDPKKTPHLWRLEASREINALTVHLLGAQFWRPFCTPQEPRWDRPQCCGMDHDTLSYVSFSSPVSFSLCPQLVSAKPTTHPQGLQSTFQHQGTPKIADPPTMGSFSLCS